MYFSLCKHPHEAGCLQAQSVTAFSGDIDSLAYGVVKKESETI
jgi:hypothetical protein